MRHLPLLQALPTAPGAPQLTTPPSTTHNWGPWGTEVDQVERGPKYRELKKSLYSLHFFGQTRTATSRSPLKHWNHSPVPSPRPPANGVQKESPRVLSHPGRMLQVEVDIYSKQTAHAATATATLGRVSARLMSQQREGMNGSL